MFAIKDLFFNKLLTGLQELRPATGSRLVVLISSGSFCPVHNGHMQMFDLAASALAEVGEQVVFGFLVPSSEGYVSRKLGEESMTLHRRVSLCEAAVSDQPQRGVLDWGIANSTQIARDLKKLLIKLLPEFQWDTVQLVGTDFALKAELWKHADAHRRYVCLMREGLALAEEVAQQDIESSRFFIKVKGVQELSSTAVRQAIRTNDVDQARKLVPRAVADMLMESREQVPYHPAVRGDENVVEQAGESWYGKFVGWMSTKTSKAAALNDLASSLNCEPAQDGLRLTHDQVPTTTPKSSKASALNDLAISFNCEPVQDGLRLTQDQVPTTTPSRGHDGISLAHFQRKSGTAYLVGVSGATRAGKSTLARKICEAAKLKGLRFKTIAQDQYFWHRGLKVTELVGANKKVIKEKNWEAPCAINHEVFAAEVRTAVSSGHYDVVIAEGFQCFHLAQLVQEMTVCLWIDVPREVLRERRMKTTPVRPEYFDQLIWPHYYEYQGRVLPQLKARADSVVYLDGTPEGDVGRKQCIQSLFSRFQKGT